MKTIFLSFSIADSSVSDFFVTLCNKLSKEFCVVVITDNYGITKIPLSTDIVIFTWPSNRPTKWKDFVFLLKKVRLFKPKMMISIFGAVNLFLMVGFLLRVPHRIAWSRTISTQFTSQGSLQLRKKYVYKLATKLFANSVATKMDLIENFSVPKRKIEVIYNAVKLPSINLQEVEKNKLVYAGRMHPSKGVDVLLESLPKVLKEFPEVELILMGGNLLGNEIRSLKEKSKSLGINGNVHFIGNQPKERVLQEFSTAYLTVVPSLVEAFGFVVIESFSVKTPVVGSDTSGIAEIIRNGKDGLLFEPGNPSDLTLKILKMYQEEKLREQFSNQCFQRFQDVFELEQATAQLFEEIRIILQE